MIPWPESFTTIRACVPSFSSLTSMEPPSGVNFTAFDSRFHTTCLKRLASPNTQSDEASSVVRSVIDLASIAGCMTSIAAPKQN